MVADDPLEKIKLKMFHSEIINDHDKLNAEVSNYRDIPAFSNVTQQQVLDNYYQVKMDIKRLIGEEVERLKAEKVWVWVHDSTYKSTIYQQLLKRNLKDRNFISNFIHYYTLCIMSEEKLSYKAKEAIFHYPIADMP